MIFLLSLKNLAVPLLFHFSKKKGRSPRDLGNSWGHSLILHRRDKEICLGYTFTFKHQSAILGSFVSFTTRYTFCDLFLFYAITPYHYTYSLHNFENLFVESVINTVVWKIELRVIYFL